MIVQPNVKSHKINLFIIFIVCLLTHMGGIRNGFVVDDHLFLSGKYDAVFRSPLDYFTVSQSQHYQPLYYLVNHTLVHAFGADPSPYRLINILLLWGAGSALYVLLVMLNGEMKGSALTAAILFAVHPLTANSVHQSTHNVVFICLIGVLGALISYLGYLEKKKKGYLAASLLCFAIALLCVEAAVLMPVYLFAILILFKGKKWSEALIALTPFAAVFGLFLILWFNVALKNSLLQAMPESTMTGGSFLSSYAILLGWYVQNLFWPHGVVLSFNILRPAVSGGALLLLLTGIGIFIWLWRLLGSRKENRLALIWAGAGFIYVIPGLLSHAYMGFALSPHWMLIPSVGFYLLAANLLSDMNVSSALKGALAGVLISYFIFFTMQYQQIARTQESFCRFWVQKSPDNAVALFELATALGQQGRPAQAITLYERLLRTGSCLSNADLVHANMARLLFETGDLAAAETLAHRALEHNRTGSNAVMAYYTLGLISADRGQKPQAIDYFERANAIDPFNTTVLFRLSDAYILAMEDEKAAGLLEPALRAPLPAIDRHQIMARLAGLCFRKNDLPRGFDYLDEIIRENPTFESFVGIAATLKSLGFNDLSHQVMAGALKAYPEKALPIPSAPR